MADTMRYRDLLSERNFMRNFYANLVNRFGDSIDALAFAWIVYEISGDRSWSALIVAFNTLPTFLLMPFAGVLVERMNKRNVMIAADLGRALLVGLVTLLYALGAATPILLALFTLCMSTLEAFRIPAGLALYPEIVPREKFTIATSFSKSAGSIATLLGTGAFGVILATLGVPGAMLINAATFLLSAAFIADIRLPKREKQKVRLDGKHYTRELKDGFAQLKKSRVIFQICLLGSLLGVFMTPYEALRTPYVQESLHLGAEALSVVSIATIVGSLAGAVFFPALNRRIRKSKLFVLGGICYGAAYLLSVAVSWSGNANVLYPAAALVAVLSGLSSSLMTVVVNVAFMEQIAPEYISRVGSIFNSLASALAPLGSLLVAGIAKALSVNQIFIAFGLLMAAFFAALLPNRTLKEIDATPIMKEEDNLEVHSV